MVRVKIINRHGDMIIEEKPGTNISFAVIAAIATHGINDGERVETELFAPDEETRK